MTIEELLHLSTEQLAAMSDAELEAHFAPMFPLCRPAMLPNAGGSVRQTAVKKAVLRTPKKSAMEELAALLGTLK